jgi:hypothetical protein
MRPGVLWRVLRGPQQRQAARAADPSAGSLQRSAIVDAMSARAMRLRSSANTDDGATKDRAQSARPRS